MSSESANKAKNELQLKENNKAKEVISNQRLIHVNTTQYPLCGRTAGVL
jgi:hypothetical protein